MDKQHNRLEILDSLRGIAAVSVMLYHYLFAYPMEFGYTDSAIVGLQYGYFGVHLFFIISGFVIYFSISNNHDVIDFLVKRFIRLFPSYWLCLIITFLAVSYFGVSPTRDTTWRDALINLTMMADVFHTRHVDGCYWSLQVELYFYFFVAFLFITKLQRYINWVLVIWLAWIIHYNFVFKLPYAGLLLGLHYAMLFIAGISFYRIKALKENNFFNHFMVIASYLTTLAVMGDKGGSFIGVTIVYSIFYLAMYDLLPFLKNKLFFFLGNISYALYLIHFYIGWIILNQFKAAGYYHPVMVIVPTVVCIFLAWLITNYYDVYVSRWLRSKLLHHRLIVRLKNLQTK